MTLATYWGDAREPQGSLPPFQGALPLTDDSALKDDRARTQSHPASCLKEAVMYAMVRSYSGDGASELFDQLEQRNDEIKELIGGVPGFVSYTAFRSGEGGSTVTVCQDKTGTDESARRAAEWVKENISATATPPVITEGGTVAYFSS